MQPVSSTPSKLESGSLILNVPLLFGRQWNYGNAGGIFLPPYEVCLLQMMKIRLSMSAPASVARGVNEKLASNKCRESIQSPVCTLGYPLNLDPEHELTSE